MWCYHLVEWYYHKAKGKKMNESTASIIEQSRRNTAGTALIGMGLKVDAVIEIVAANPGCPKSVPAARRGSFGSRAQCGMEAVREAISRGLISDKDGHLNVTAAGAAMMAERLASDPKPVF